MEPGAPRRSMLKAPIALCVSRLRNSRRVKIKQQIPWVPGRSPLTCTGARTGANVVSSLIYKKHIVYSYILKFDWNLDSLTKRITTYLHLLPNGERSGAHIRSRQSIVYMAGDGDFLAWAEALWHDDYKQSNVTWWHHHQGQDAMTGHGTRGKLLLAVLRTVLRTVLELRRGTASACSRVMSHAAARALFTLSPFYHYSHLRLRAAGAALHSRSGALFRRENWMLEFL